jgi:hypothetical protein
MNEVLKPRVWFNGKHYRNEKLAGFIGCFINTAQQDAAWATVRFIRENWPETDETLRGGLVGEDEGEA